MFMPACSSGARRIERPRTEAAGAASRSAPWTAARGGAIIVRESRGERATRAGVQGVIGDLLLPSRSAAALLRAGTWSTATIFLWCCISSD